MIWAWHVEGVEIPSGTMQRSGEDYGVVDAELAGDVVAWLAEHGPFWDWLDTDRPFTIRIGKPSSRVLDTERGVRRAAARHIAETHPHGVEVREVP